MAKTHWINRILPNSCKIYRTAIDSHSIKSLDIPNKNEDFKKRIESIIEDYSFRQSHQSEKVNIADHYKGIINKGKIMLIHNKDIPLDRSEKYGLVYIGVHPKIVESIESKIAKIDYLRIIE